LIIQTIGSQSHVSPNVIRVGIETVVLGTGSPIPSVHGVDGGLLVTGTTPGELIDGSKVNIPLYPDVVPSAGEGSAGLPTIAVAEARCVGRQCADRSAERD
jgi:hypothetical protein